MGCRTWQYCKPIINTTVMASIYTFTFEPSSTKKIIDNIENSEPFYAVLEKTYPKALAKVLKMKLPGIDSGDDLKLISVQEEYEDDSDTEKVSQ